MKKALLPLIVLMFLFISVSPASAKRSHCMQYDYPVRISSIEPNERIIVAPYLWCADDPFGGGGYDVDVSLFVTDTTKIRFSGESWDATFEHLSTEGQRIDFSFQTIDNGKYLIEGIAKTITIYPD